MGNTAIFFDGWIDSSEIAPLTIHELCLDESYGISMEVLAPRATNVTLT